MSKRDGRSGKDGKAREREHARIAEGRRSASANGAGEGEGKAARKAAKKAAKLLAKAPISAVEVTSDDGTSAKAAYDPVTRILELVVPRGPAGRAGTAGPRGGAGPRGPQGPHGPQGVQGPEGASGAGIDFSLAPDDGRLRAIYLDAEGRLSYRDGDQHFLISLTAKG